MSYHPLMSGEQTPRKVRRAPCHPLIFPRTCDRNGSKADVHTLLHTQKKAIVQSQSAVPESGHFGPECLLGALMARDNDPWRWCRRQVNTNLAYCSEVGEVGVSALIIKLSHNAVFLFLLLDHFERLTANTQSKCFIDLLDNYLKVLQRNQLFVCVWDRALVCMIL